jgi:hypothetical protein
MFDPIIPPEKRRLVTGSLKFSMLEEMELRDVRQLLVILHDEIHHPGAARHTNPRYDIDAKAAELLYVIDHALENLKE